MSEILATEDGRQDEQERVQTWRAHMLAEAGVDPLRALELAANPLVDVHYLVDLVEQGATPQQAATLAERDD